MTTPATAGNAEPELLRHDKDGIATLTLNRPDHFNALSESLLDALHAGLDDLARDDSVRVVVLAASGRAFCAGHDLKEMRSHPEQAYYENLFAQCSQVMLDIMRVPKPVIARVHGVATAAGCQLVATCDLAVASEKARFAVSGVNLGLFCSTPGVALSRNVPRKRAFEMLITGDFIDANTAAEWGLVNRVVPPDDLDGAVRSLCDSIRAKSPVAVETGKRMFYQQVEKNVDAAYDYASQIMACNMMAEDTINGIDAFMAKEPPPPWKGR